jgi:hypothetical protein
MLAPAMAGAAKGKAMQPDSETATSEIPKENIVRFAISAPSCLKTFSEPPGYLERNSETCLWCDNLLCWTTG